MDIFVAENSQKKVLVPDCKPAPNAPHFGYNFGRSYMKISSVVIIVKLLSYQNLLLLAFQPTNNKVIILVLAYFKPK